jgi:flagellar biosynthesis/type III secretory pathway M-ring protein FliF/YscJ
MNEREFGESLLRLDVAARPPADARALTDRVLARDARRVRVLTWLTVGTGGLAAALVLVLMVYFALLFPMMAKLKDPAYQARSTPAEREQTQEQLEVAFRMTSVVITMTVGAVAVAGLCTLGLMAATRRATLRQVNANLAEIAEQLKQLRQGPPRPAAGP